MYLPEGAFIIERVGPGPLGAIALRGAVGIGGRAGGGLQVGVGDILAVVIIEADNVGRETIQAFVGALQVVGDTDVEDRVTGSFMAISVSSEGSPESSQPGQAGLIDWSTQAIP